MLFILNNYFCVKIKLIYFIVFFLFMKLIILLTLMGLRFWSGVAGTKGGDFVPVHKKGLVTVFNVRIQYSK